MQERKFSILNERLMNADSRARCGRKRFDSSADSLPPIVSLRALESTRLQVAAAVEGCAVLHLHLMMMTIYLYHLLQLYVKAPT
jgi:hypothetical protein